MFSPKRLWCVLSISLFTASLNVFALPRPLLLDRDGRPLFQESARTVCGNNDMTAMQTESDDLKKMGTPIGIWEVDMGGGTGMCTGTLISKDLMLTAQHCEGECSGIEVTFGYLSEQRKEKFKCKEIVEKGDGSLDKDYLIIRLEGSPGVAWGWYDMSARKLDPGQALMMIHHPSGSPMKVSRKNCSLVEQKSDFISHRCDTQPGSSGAGILVPDFQHPANSRIIGVHTLGGCNQDETDFNSGPAIRHLAETSPLIRSMVKDD
jgi:V8-like Glu-specific endopeptidase